MPIAVLSPLTAGRAVELGNRFWSKKLLPVGDVEYRGRVLHFTPRYLQDLAQAFTAGAYDSVPFQSADGDNKHTNDPERTRGWLTGLDVRPDGLYCTVETTERGHARLRENPRLGVSARIVEQYARSDGKFFPQALQHVLGTLDPRIPELGPWQAVEASNAAEVDETINLSNLAWENDADNPAAADDPAVVALLDGLTDEQAGELLAYVDSLTDADIEALEDQAATEADLTDEDRAAVAALQTEQCANGSADYASADLSNEYSPDDGIELAAQQLSHAYDYATAREMVRASQSAARPARTTEVRLANAYQRILEGTYVPATLQFDFAAPSEAGRALAQVRWQQANAEGNGNCGSADAYGRCAEPYHDASCSSLSDTPTATVYKDSGLYDETAGQPFEDSRGQTWLSQHGEAMTLLDHVEAATGIKVGDGLWSTGTSQRETIVAQRVLRWGDPDDPDAASPELPEDSRVSALIAGTDMHLTDPQEEAYAARDRYAQRRAAALAQMSIRNGFRPGHSDYFGETPGQRAERIKGRTPFALQAQKDDADLLPGELQQFSAG
jgi:hypothetical protein